MSLECCKDNFYVIFLMLQYLQNWDILLSQVVEPYPSNRLRKEPENPVPNRLVAWYFCGVLWYLRLKQWQTARTVCHLISFILFIKYHFVLLSLLQVCHLQLVIRSHRLFRHFLRESVLQLMYQRVSADIV